MIQIRAIGYKIIRQPFLFLCVLTTPDWTSEVCREEIDRFQSAEKRSFQISGIMGVFRGPPSAPTIGKPRPGPHFPSLFPLRPATPPPPSAQSVAAAAVTRFTRITFCSDFFFLIWESILVSIYKMCFVRGETGG